MVDFCKTGEKLKNGLLGFPTEDHTYILNPETYCNLKKSRICEPCEC